MRLSFRIFAIAAAVASFPSALGGPFAFGLCQAGCHAAVAGCYGTLGTVPVVAPGSIWGYNALYATCMAGCAALGTAPTP